MGKRSGDAETRISSFGPEKRWRFVKTKYGIEYCVDQILFRGGKLREVDCYRFDENGTMSTVQLSPTEIQDLSEISEFLNQPLG
jgi:hypothetical protein